MSETSKTYFGYRDAKDYANKTAGTLYPKGCDRVKINKKAAIRLTELGHLAGEAETALGMLCLFLENPNEDYDIILGELQLKVKEKWNALSKALVEKGSFSMKPVDIESIIEQSEKVIKTIQKERDNAERIIRNDLAGIAEISRKGERGEEFIQ